MMSHLHPASFHGWRVLALAGLAAVWLTGCLVEEPIGPDAGPEDTFTMLYQSIGAGCAGCHAPGALGFIDGTEATQDWSSRDSAYDSLQGMASGLMGNFAGCNGVPFIGDSPETSLLVAVFDQQVRAGFSPASSPYCDANSISDMVLTIGHQLTPAERSLLTQFVMEESMRILPTASLAVTPVQVEATPVQVTVTIMRVIEVSCDDGAFTICPDDYYGRVNIADQGFQETDNGQFEDQGDISPFWRFTRTVDSSLGSIPVTIQIWDDDDASADDLLDISSVDESVDLTVDLATGFWTGDVPQNVGFSQGSHAKILFDISISGNGDIDGDGIPDGVERFGVRDGNGNIVANLAAMGADPCRKTIAVEIDFMEQMRVGHTHRPMAAAIAEAVAAYSAAPVAAITPCPYAGFPTQPTGVNFVVDVDDALPEQANLDWGAGGEAVRNANFDGARRPFFHYSLWVHNRGTGNTSSGLCCSDSGKDALVSLGSWANSVGMVRDQSGTLMHELGHALGFGHGGSDTINCKPNYLSIMSYTLQTTGIPDPTLPALNVDLNNDGTPDARLRLDYSRSQLPTLNEAALVEANGIGDGTDLATWSANSGASTQTAAGNGPIDWNVSTVIDLNPVAVDINNLGFFDCGTDGATPPNPTPSPGQMLVGFDDWQKLKYRAALSPDAGFIPPPATELDFATSEIIKAHAAATLQPDPKLAMVASPTVVLTGSNVTYTITLTNGRPIQADNVVVTDLLPPGLTFVSCGATGGGVCGGSGSNRTVTFATLAGNATETITLVTAVDCSIVNGSTISNTASVTADTPDFNPTNNSATAIVTASNPPPVISDQSANPSTLWPPDHTMRDITVDYVVTDNCGVPSLSLTAASNEPVDGTGDGDMSPDWIILDAHHLQLRAERAGGGNGRTYTVTISATDSGGGSSTEQVQVVVPKHQ